MRRFTSPLRLALALVAAAASVAAPLLAYAHHAVPARAGTAEVCTAAGIKRVPLEPSDERQIPGERSHCGACVTSSGAEAPVRAQADLPVPASRARALPALRAASTPVELIRAARPRGPPASAFSV
jgi:hypothetical protein